LFTFAVDDRRGHAFNLYKDMFKLDIGRFSSSNRVGDSWNHLPNDIVTASALNSPVARPTTLHGLLEIIIIIMLV